MCKVTTSSLGALSRKFTPALSRAAVLFVPPGRDLMNGRINGKGSENLAGAWGSSNSKSHMSRPNHGRMSLLVFLSGMLARSELIRGNCRKTSQFLV